MLNGLGGVVGKSHSPLSSHSTTEGNVNTKLDICMHVLPFGVRVCFGEDAFVVIVPPVFSAAHEYHQAGVAPSVCTE